MEIEVSLSALTPSQYRPFMKMFKPDPEILRMFQKISGRMGNRAMRLYFDFQSDKLLKGFSPECPSEIKDYLVEKGFVLEDYVSGTARDKHDRVVRIGKILSKNKELAKTFESDPNRKAIVSVTRGKKTVCLSMHPYDVAGMSTGRGWTSCMDLVDGINNKYVKEDIKHHTLVAYLIDSSDKDLKRPLSRVLLKRFYATNKKDFFYHVEKVYPMPNAPFIISVQEFVNEHINKYLMPEGGFPDTTYMLQEDLYNDTGAALMPELSLDSADPERVRNILGTRDPRLVADIQWDLLANKFKDDLFSMVFTEARISEPDKFNNSTLVLFCDAMRNVLTKEKFERMMLSLGAYMMRTKRQYLINIVFYMSLYYRTYSFLRMCGRTPEIDVLMRDLGRNIGVLEPRLRDTEARLQFFEDLVEPMHEYIKDRGLFIRSFALLCGEVTHFMELDSFVHYIKKFEKYIEFDTVVDYASYFNRPEHKLKALALAYDTDQIKELNIGTFMYRVYEKEFSDAMKQKFFAAMNEDDMLQACLKWSHDKRFEEMLKANGESMGFNYFRERHRESMVTFYPTIRHNDQAEFLFVVAESLLDTAYQLTDQ